MFESLLRIGSLDLCGLCNRPSLIFASDQIKTVDRAIMNYHSVYVSRQMESALAGNHERVETTLKAWSRVT